MDHKGPPPSPPLCLCLHWSVLSKELTDTLTTRSPPLAENSTTSTRAPPWFSLAKGGSRQWFCTFNALRFEKGFGVPLIKKHVANHSVIFHSKDTWPLQILKGCISHMQTFSKQSPVPQPALRRHTAGSKTKLSSCRSGAVSGPREGQPSAGLLPIQGQSQQGSSFGLGNTVLEYSINCSSPEGGNVIGVQDFITVTNNLLFFNFTIICKCGLTPAANIACRGGTRWHRNCSPRPTLLFLLTTCCLYLQELVIMFLPLPHLSPTHAHTHVHIHTCTLTRAHTHVHTHMCIHTHNFVISHTRPRARHGAHPQMTQRSWLHLHVQVTGKTT